MLHERLKKLRQDKGYTQEKVARDLDIPESSLRRWETNKGVPKHERLPAIADYFGCSVDYLMGRVDNPHQSLSEETRDVIDSLELSDEDIRKKFHFELDGRPVSEDEYKWFIASVRSKRSLE